uniref:hypothetical protein n=1 Tax=Merotricha bacillata TaxID=658122 RepID=UPI002113FCF1|nr:hypothetical protein NQZ01_pgp059 [Merotricha bacillata]UTE94595.1 hypothetical protein MbacPt_p122 [Merotricha bacillata]
MVLFDIVQLLFSLLKSQVYENFLMRTESFYRFMSWFLNLPLIFKINSFKNYLSTDYLVKTVDFIVTIIPEKFLVNVREFFVCFRLLFDLRLLVGWFPINTWKGPLSLITEPVDMILRNLYFLPKVYYIDIPFLLVSTGLDNLVSLLDFIIAVARQSKEIS